jgi:DNA topoisomerase-1
LREFPDSPLQILNGRFGPYITDGQKNVRVPKEREPASLSLTECQTLLREAPEKKSAKSKTKPAARRRSAKSA